MGVQLREVIAATTVRGAILRFGLTGLLVLALVGIGGVEVLSRVGRREAIREARELTSLAGEGIIAPAVTPALLRGDPRAVRAMDGVVARLDAGAVGYLLADTDPEDLLDAVRAAARGESPLSPKIAAHLLAPRLARRRDEGLTDREGEVLSLLAAGHPNDEIARRLGIAHKTVKNHMSHIFETLRVTDRTQAALWAHARAEPAVHV